MPNVTSTVMFLIGAFLVGFSMGTRLWELVPGIVGIMIVIYTVIDITQQLR